jgi:hypothetical protein
MIRITDQTAEAMRAAQALLARDEALAQVLELLDPSGKRSAWAIAGDIEDARKRLARGMVRIRAGHREATPLEQALMVAERAGLPASRRRVWDLLNELSV